MAGMSAVEEQAAVRPPRVDGEWTVEDPLRSPDYGDGRLVAQGGPGDIVTVDGPLRLSFDPAALVG